MDQEFGHGFLGPLIFRIFQALPGPRVSTWSSVFFSPYNGRQYSLWSHNTQGGLFLQDPQRVSGFSLWSQDPLWKVFTWLSQATVDHLPFWSAQCKLIRPVNYTCKTPSALPSGLNTWPSCTVSTGCRACHSVLTQLFLFLILTWY